MLDIRMLFGLENKVALVTGGTRGLGRAMVTGLASAGAHLVIASRHGVDCERFAQEISTATGRRAMGYGVHVGHWDELDGLVDTAYQEFGSIDVLVNNAGMSPLYDSLDKVTEVLFDKVINVNLKATFRLSTLVGTRMAAGVGGSIINISSMAAVRPRPEMLPYAAAKAGLNALTVGLARSFGPTVRVNAIMAGTFFTDVSKVWDMNAFTERARGFAIQRGGQPEEIVGSVLYLASDASSYTTGTVLQVDGGQ